jgi:beta-lactamase regulating signal transducer with metallopeptidase domain
LNEKIPFDILIFLVYGDSLFFNINPFSCEVFVFELIANYVPLSLGNENHLVIPQYIAGQIPAFWLTTLTIVVCTATVVGISRKLYLLYLSKKDLKDILEKAIPFHLSVRNDQLKKALQQVHTKILISSKIEMPFAADPFYILIPEKLISKLSQDELEAVIAHELQHIRWMDPLLKFFYSIICSLCWWIPSKKFLNQLIDNQEQASDAGIFNYGIDKFSLANAMTKILRNAKSAKSDVLTRCFLGSSQNMHVERLQLLLNSDKNKPTHIKDLLVITLSIVTFLSLWMC